MFALNVEGNGDPATNLPQSNPGDDNNYEYLKLGFWQLEKEEVHMVAKGGLQKSLYIEQWARN